jgi:hypothetical protein
VSVQGSPSAAPKEEISDAELIALWKEAGRDPLKFALKLQEATACPAVSSG